MTEVFIISAVACFVAVFGLLLRKNSAEIGLLLSLCGAVLIYFLLLHRFFNLFDTLHRLLDGAGYADMLQIMLRALGVVLLGKISAGVCHDAGNQTLEAGIEFGVRLALLWIALPVLESILETMQEVMWI